MNDILTMQNIPGSNFIAEISKNKFYSDDVKESISKLPLDFLEYISELQKRADEAIGSLNRYVVGDDSISITDRSIQMLAAQMSAEKIGSKIIALAGAGGAGKDTVRLSIDDIGGLKYPKITTRDSRVGEVSGVDYTFTDLAGLVDLTGNSVEGEDGKVVMITAEAAIEIQNLFGIMPKTNGNYLTLEDLGLIQTKVDQKLDGIDLGDYNIGIDKNFGGLELILRRERGWYASNMGHINTVLGKTDNVVLTGNPENLVSMTNDIREIDPSLKVKFTYVLAPFPMIYHMVARALNRDGVNQDIAKLYSTTDMRQVKELEDFVSLVTSGRIPLDDLIVVENRDLVNTDKGMRSVVGEQLAAALLG